MKYYQFTNQNGTYRMSLRDTGRRNDMGKVIARYALWREDLPGHIFSGEDLGVAPSHKPEGRRSAAALLSFIGRHTDDLDDETLASYTPQQKMFASYDCANNAMDEWQERLDPEEYGRDR